MTKLSIIKNTEAAPNLGSRFGQDVEPSGTYVLEKSSNYVPPGWLEGTAYLENPLYIEVDSDTLISYKKDLSDKYKAKGKILTDKLMQIGYDALITHRSNGDTGEIVLFPNSKFTLSNPDDMISESYKKRLQILSGIKRI